MVFLRKKRRSTVSATSRSELGHSLSLPDLTTPLIDEASWEELPAFAKFIPELSNTVGKSNGATIRQHTIDIVTPDNAQQGRHAHVAGYNEFGAFSPPRPLGASREPITPGAINTATPTRNRSPSLISAKGGGSPIAFHRPFRGDNVFSPPLTAPPVPSYATLPYGMDFRKSASGWSLPGVARAHGRGHGARYEDGDGLSTIGSVRPNSMVPGRRKRGKGKVVSERLNVVVAGGRGLIRLLSSEPPKDPFPPSSSQTAGPATSLPSILSHQTPTPSSPTSAGPPLPSLSSPITSDPRRRLSTSLPSLTEPAPTRSLSAHQALIQQPHLQRALAIRFIDTPGLDVQADDGPAVHAYIRERGVNALLGMVEGQCEAVLREESKVLRKGTAGADELVHLYARRVLHPEQPAIEPDWGFQGLFLSDDIPLSPVKSNETGMPARPLSTVDMKPRVPEADMQTIRSLKKRMTVLPVLTYADALSTIELARVKDAVRRDMAAAFTNEEGAGFGLFGVTDETNEPDSPEAPTSSEGQHNPLTPALTDSSVVAEQEMPYAIFCPSTSTMPATGAAGVGLGLGAIGETLTLPTAATGIAAKREFAWGSADVWDGEHSDMGKLRESIFEVNTKALKNHTRQVLYERFRTERLLAHRARRGIAEEAETA